MPLAATWMDLEIILLNEVRERQTSCVITYTWDLSYDTNEFIYKIETGSQTENKLMVTNTVGGIF